MQTEIFEAGHVSYLLHKSLCLETFFFFKLIFKAEMIRKKQQQWLVPSILTLS